jgi:hypothetical protein
VVENFIDSRIEDLKPVSGQSNNENSYQYLQAVKNYQKKLSVKKAYQDKIIKRA